MLRLGSAEGLGVWQCGRSSGQARVSASNAKLLQQRVHSCRQCWLNTTWSAPASMAWFLAGALCVPCKRLSSITQFLLS